MHDATAMISAVDKDDILSEAVSSRWRRMRVEVESSATVVGCRPPSRCSLPLNVLSQLAFTHMFGCDRSSGGRRRLAVEILLALSSLQHCLYCHCGVLCGCVGVCAW